MKLLASVMVLLSLVSVSFASDYRMLFDSVSGECIMKGYVQDDPNYVSVVVDPNDRLNQIPLNNVKYSNGQAVEKNQTEKDSISNAKRKVEIRQEIRRLKQENYEALQERTEGFDVTAETTTIKQQIKDLKQEYNSLQ